MGYAHNRAMCAHSISSSARHIAEQIRQGGYGAHCPSAPIPARSLAVPRPPLVLVLFSDASRIGLHPLRADLRLCLRLLGIALPLAIGLGTLLAFIVPELSDI